MITSQSFNSMRALNTMQSTINNIKSNYQYKSNSSFAPGFIPQISFIQQQQQQKLIFQKYLLNSLKPKRRKTKTNANKNGLKHGIKFTKEEDEKLKELVDKYGSQKWDLIADEMPGRNGRQCRDRYKNYLTPGYFNGQWSREEDLILKMKFKELGPQWSKITDFLKNRSSNAVKNRWNYFVSKHLEDDKFDQFNNFNKQSVNQSNSVDLNEKKLHIDPLCEFFDFEKYDENDDSNFDDDFFEFN